MIERLGPRTPAQGVSGIRLWASTSRPIGILILYDYDSTVVRPLSRADSRGHGVGTLGRNDAKSSGNRVPGPSARSATGASGGSGSRSPPFEGSPSGIGWESAGGAPPRGRVSAPTGGLRLVFQAPRPVRRATRQRKSRGSTLPSPLDPAPRALSERSAGETHRDGDGPGTSRCHSPARLAWDSRMTSPLGTHGPRGPRARTNARRGPHGARRRFRGSSR
jgi:hypothetical protein